MFDIFTPVFYIFIFMFVMKLGAHVIYTGSTGMYMKRVYLGATYLSRTASKK